MAGNLRLTATTAAVIDRHLQDAQTGGRYAHLHLEVPAIGGFTHAETPELIGAHGPEWRHVGETHAIDELEQDAGKRACHDLLRSHAARFAPTAQRSEEHTSELQSPCNLVCRLLLEKKHNS